MGSYGIGPARIIAAFIELNNDKDGIIWNEQLSPFDVIVVNIIKDSDEYAKQVYRTLQNLGLDVLFDDTSDSAGQKFAKADLLGIPKQIIVSQKLQDSKSLEIKDRKTGIKTIISLESLSAFFS
jgi:prolyl-tRNA synthetase